MFADKVLVYLYSSWDDESKSHKTSTRYATIDAIKNGLGVPVLKSERKIKRSELIDGSFYDRNSQNFPDRKRAKTPKTEA